MAIGFLQLLRNFFRQDISLQSMNHWYWTSGFFQLIVSGCFYADKTEFIREWWKNEDVVIWEKIVYTLIYEVKIAFFVKTYSSKLAIINKNARRIYNEGPERSC